MQGVAEEEAKLQADYGLANGRRRGSLAEPRPNAGGVETPVEDKPSPKRTPVTLLKLSR